MDRGNRWRKAIVAISRQRVNRPFSPWWSQYASMPAFVVWFCCLMAPVASAAEDPAGKPAGAAPDRVLVTPADTGASLENPGMGWVLYYYDHHLARYGARLSPADTVDDFPGATVVYMAVPWAFLEPREGRYDWSLLDTPGQRWMARGKQIALRFTCCEPFYEYASPRWVQEAGARFHRFETSQRTRDWIRQSLERNIPTHCWAPDYSDPIFLEKHLAFLQAAAKRYDANPRVAFIDVGSFGTWGEGHTAFSCRRQYDAAVKIKHLEIYRKAFPDSLLVAGDDLLRADGRDSKELIDRAVELEMALRDDSVLVSSLNRIAESEAMAQRFWPDRPIILEPAHYGMATKWWNTWRDGSPYLESIERYRASYAGVHWWPREFLAENRPLIDRVNRRLGYRIQVTQASWPKVIQAGRPWVFDSRWRNAGVAPCYGGGHPALTLKDDEGGIVAALIIPEVNVRDLPVVGSLEQRTVSHVATLSVPAASEIPPGSYSLYISVGALDGSPRLALPLAADDGHRRYRLGAATIE